ncbi:MAG: hypothetical protein F6K14_11745 [Symploca sp. SIO2C1]|nr:hypothetical protein [Symploca sp. SIO2C1]
MPRKSRYNQEIVETICEAIATEGGDEVGWLAGGISEPTFYAWMKRYPEFGEAVVRAREDFRKRCPKYQKGLALAKLTEALENGQPIKWTTKKTRRLDHYVPGKKGEPAKLVWYDEETITEEHIEHRPTPKWAIERVIPRPIEDDLNVAIAFVEKNGFKVIVEDEEIIQQWLNSQNGHKGTKELPGTVE